MFRSAELGHKVSKKDFSAAEAELRPALVQAQLRAHELGIPLIIVVNGVDGAGKSESVHHLMEWMDPRLIDVHALEKPTDVERELAFYYRFWKRLPSKGRTSIFLGSWYSATILNRVYGKLGSGAFRKALEDVTRFERMLADEGILLLKLWMHISKKVQKKRLRDLSEDEDTSWRVTRRDWKHFELYDRFYETCEDALRHTSHPHARWNVIEGSDDRYRSLEVSRRVLTTLRERISMVEAAATPAPASQPSEVIADGTNILDALHLEQKLEDSEYTARMRAARDRLNWLARRCYEKGRSAVLVFEGCDAAGKGGAIRRLVRPMHPKTYRIVPIAAPTKTELSYPYLWRFWNKLPRDGKLTIFDRSWYGRVLVERIEGFCRPADWARAFSEIRDFEEQIHESGTRVIKFWLQISQEEQLRRFEAREQTPHKAHKITAEDWRNREKWPRYKAAICEMIDRTDATIAPWTLIEAEDKQWARVKVLETVVGVLEEMV